MDTKCRLFFKILFLLAIICNTNSASAQNDATAWFNKGANASSPQEKIICYTRAIELNPKFIEAYYNLGYVYKSQDDYANAEKAFREAILKDPDNLSNDDLLRFSYELGITLKKLNRSYDALEMLTVARNLAVSTEVRAAVLYEIGKLKIAMGNFDEAAAEFREGLQLRSSKQDAFQAAIQSANAMKALENQYAQGISYFESAQYDKAIEMLAQVINQNPNYKDASQKLARAQGLKSQRAQTDELERTYARGIGYMQNNDWKNAILALTQVNQSNPDYKDVAFKLEEAKAKFSQSLVAEGYETLYSKGVSAYNEKDWVKAIVAFEKVREWNPNFKNIRRMYTDAQNQLNQEEQSTVKMRYYNQGKTDIGSGDWEGAISNFEQLVRLDSNFKDTQQLLNQARNELQRETEANQIDKLYSEGKNYFDNGDWLKSIIAFEKVQQLKPGYRDVSEKLVLAQNYSNTQKETDIAIDVSPGETESQKGAGNFITVALIISLSLIPLGIVFFMVPAGRIKLLLIQGKYQQAASIYESLLLKKPHKVKLYPELAQIYSLLNRKDETALKVYDISLQQDISMKLKEKLIDLTDQKNNNTTNHIEINTLEEQLKLELASLNNKTI